MHEINPIKLAFGEDSLDAIDGQASVTSYNPLPEFNGITEVYTSRKTNIDVLGATKECFDKTLTVFYINV